MDWSFIIPFSCIYRSELNYWLRSNIGPFSVVFNEQRWTYTNKSINKEYHLQYFLFDLLEDEIVQLKLTFPELILQKHRRSST